MVFVLDKHKKPLMPCSEKRARQLLERGKAVIHQKNPFTIRLKDRTAEESSFQPLRLKLDPGSKITGIAVLREGNEEEGVVIYIGELHHRLGIKQRLDSRRGIRRSRRNRKTRYRKPRFNNRRRSKGWLPPSLQSRVDQVLNIVKKFSRLLPITAMSTENVKFDTQKLENAEISGVEYQQGTLFGYEVKEYLLEKWGRKCIYCGRENIPLQVEHIVPKSRGGTDRVSNLTLSCVECNQKKGPKTAEEFGFFEVQVEAGRPLKDAAMMNATRWKLYRSLKDMECLVEYGSGALTKYNRIQRGFSKTHGYDAVCVGKSTPKTIKMGTHYLCIWKSLGRGHRRLCKTDKFGFPKNHRQNKKLYFGFQTGDFVIAEISRGKYQGIWRGSVIVRRAGYFDMKSASGDKICQGISHKYFRVLQRKTGWLLENIAI